MSPRVAVPSYLITAARERRARFVARENDLAAELTQYYASMLGGFRTDLRKYFDQFFLLSTDPEKPDPVWDFISAKRAGIPDRLADDFEQVISDAESDAADELGSALVDSYDEGRDEAMYLLGLVGLTLADVPSLDPEAVATAIEDNGIDGEAWGERLTAWTETYADKFRKGVKGAMVLGATFAATADVFDRLADQLVGRVVGLGQNELYRADALGSAEIMAPLTAKGAIKEVWVSRGDSLVCPFCQSLHLTITALRPEDDSHANCRCIKVPWVAEYPQNAAFSARYFDAFQRSGSPYVTKAPYFKNQ
jgi:hypothetical protein